MRSFLIRVAVVVLVGMFAITLLRKRGSEKFRTEQHGHDAECRAYRSRASHEVAEVCRTADVFGPRATGLFKQGSAALAESKRQLEAGETAHARVAIVRALTLARDIERRGRLFDEVLAASLLARVVSFLETHPNLDDATLLDAFPFDGLRAPLEGERIQHLWMLAHADDASSWLFDNRGALAERMKVDDAAYREIERAGLAGDTTACQRAARKLGLPLGGEQDPVVACEKLPMIARTMDRLEQARHLAL